MLALVLSSCWSYRPPLKVLAMSPPQLSSQLPMALIRDGGGAGGAVGRALLCLSLAVLALPFCAAQEGDAQAQTASQKKQVVLQAAGASFPNLVYQDLIFAYQFVAPHVKMSYLSTGSGGGQCRIKVRVDEYSIDNTHSPTGIGIARFISAAAARNRMLSPDCVRRHGRGTKSSHCCRTSQRIALLPTNLGRIISTGPAQIPCSRPQTMWPILTCSCCPRYCMLCPPREVKHLRSFFSLRLRRLFFLALFAPHQGATRREP